MPPDVDSYTRYADTADPPPIAGADHDSTIADAVCTVLRGAAGTPGDVDCTSSSLRSPSPAPLSALTANVYAWPPVSPDSVADAALPLYATVVTADAAVVAVRVASRHR